LTACDIEQAIPDLLTLVGRTDRTKFRKDLLNPLLEDGLVEMPDGKASLDSLIQNPATFPFFLPAITGSLALSTSPRIDLCRYGIDDELMMLK